VGVESTLRRTSEGMRRSMLHSTASESATTVATGHPPDGAVLWQTRCDSYTAVTRWAQSWAFTSVVWRRMHGRTRVRRLQQRAPREAGALLGSGTARGSLWCATDCVNHCDASQKMRTNLRLCGVRPPHILALGDLHPNGPRRSAGRAPPPTHRKLTSSACNRSAKLGRNACREESISHCG
jgi:hypothetical protein